MATTASTARQTVVVGIDGSRCSLDALRWAARYARAVGALLRPLIAWSSSSRSEYVTKPDFETFAKDNMNQALRILQKEFSDVAVEPGIVEGPAASILIDTSRDADLLVVGTRGLGGISGIFIESVSRNCVQHSGGPVVTIRERVDSTPQPRHERGNASAAQPAPRSR